MLVQHRPASYPAPLSQLPYQQSFGSSSYGAAPGYAQPIQQYANNYTLATQHRHAPLHPQAPTHYSPHHSTAAGFHSQGHPASVISHHPAHQDDGPISPYPELKDLHGPLLRSHHHHHHGDHHHPMPHGQHHSGHHGQTQHPQHFHRNFPPSPLQHHRETVGLPDFPQMWVADPHDHQHRPTYEQMLYSAWEHHHKLEQQEIQRHGGNLGLGADNSDMQAMNAALAGPQGWMIQSHNSGSPTQLLEPIKRLMDIKRHEAERARDVVYQYENSRGPQDPVTQQAQELALHAEAEASGVLAVERALEAAADGQGLHAISETVAIFEEEKSRASVAWSDAQGRFGENHPKTVGERVAMLKADAAWQGATAAQSAPAQRGFEEAEHPQAIANRASAAADAYSAEAEELNKRADQLRRKWGNADPRVAQAQAEADEAAAKAKSALLESQEAQGFVDGKPLATASNAAPVPKKKAKKKQRGIC